jgi:hypothetical protein
MTKFAVAFVAPMVGSVFLPGSDAIRMRNRP